MREDWDIKFKGSHNYTRKREDRSKYVNHSIQLASNIESSKEERNEDIIATNELRNMSSNHKSSPELESKE